MDFVSNRIISLGVGKILTIGLGSTETLAPNSSATRWSRNLASQRWSLQRCQLMFCPILRVEKQCSDFDLPHLNSLARADLELPLSGHDFCVGSRDLDTGVKAAPVVRLDDVTLDNLLHRTSVQHS